MVNHKPGRIEIGARGVSIEAPASFQVEWKSTPLSAQQILTHALVLTGEENRQAFREVYELTSSKLFGICVRVCGDYGIAQDILHDVYLTIWKRAGAFDPSRGSAITWMATIARNRSIDWRRTQFARRTIPIESIWEIADPLPLVSETILADEARASVLVCLNTLDQRQRDAVCGAFFYGLTHAEMARQHGVPLGTMKSWIRRGLAKLRRALDDAELGP